jgi:hypothetical protein
VLWQATVARYLKVNVDIVTVFENGQGERLQFLGWAVAF